jgi:hypothetical protein
MELFWSILIILFTMTAGFVIQYYIRLSPWINLAVSFPLVLLIPPSWGFGLICGIWICCAFSTFHPEMENKIDAPNRIRFVKILLYSLLTFSGFLLTLVLLWKFKIMGNPDLAQREVFAWIFLAIVEICLYKVIARLAPGLYRIPLGYGIAVLNFLMILYWVSGKGIYFMVLVFFTMLIVNPLLLTWVEPVARQGEPYSWRK